MELFSVQNGPFFEVTPWTGAPALWTAPLYPQRPAGWPLELEVDATGSHARMTVDLRVDLLLERAPKEES